jgi:cytochrome c oxidase subunit 2
MVRTPSRPGRAAILLTLAAVAVLASVACGGGDSPPALGAEAAKGQQAAKDRGCTNCHTPDGRRSEGPTWKGLYGSTVQLADGSSTVADDAYLARSVKEPRAQMVQGYKVPMPTTPGITDAEIAAITEYIKALK